MLTSDLSILDVKQVSLYTSIDFFQSAGKSLKSEIPERENPGAQVKISWLCVGGARTFGGADARSNPRVMAGVAQCTLRGSIPPPSGRVHPFVLEIRFCVESAVLVSHLRFTAAGVVLTPSACLPALSVCSLSSGRGSVAGIRVAAPGLPCEPAVLACATLRRIWDPVVSGC
jgi:hypothetical protein